MTTFHNRLGLGAVLNTAQQPGQLGDEADVTAFTVDSATGVLNNTNSGRIRVKLVKNTSGTTLAPGVLVQADVNGDMDTDVTLAGVSSTPSGIVDPYLPSPVPAGAQFLIVTYASRISVVTGAAFAKGLSLRGDASGRAIPGASGFMRALQASSGANQRRDVTCNFCTVSLSDNNQAKAQRFVLTTAQVNAGAVLLPAVPGVRYRIQDMALIAVGGNASGATSVDIRGVQAASTVSLMAGAVAGLTQNALLRAGAANGAILAAGASFAECDTNTAVTLARIGSDLATSTAVHVLLTYEVVAG